MTTIIPDYINLLAAEFEKHRDPERADQMHRYVRNLFTFYGIQAPDRRAIMRDFIRDNGLPEFSQLPQMIEKLWDKPERDFQYFGMETSYKFRREFDFTTLDMLEKMIIGKSWWDSVDYIATNLVGPILIKDPDLQTEKSGQWLVSNNIWLQRTAIIFQLKYKKKTNLKLLADNIIALSDKKEFFIAKAIGWALREYSKTDRAMVIDFVSQNKLQPLSHREALKWINNHPN